ncbi:expressed unknown protein [Seminavis robusta]|uniref:Uncharacterized protein n=1 Tax=Seminavis robusta TaxID=568900 RepID=A0A9N8DSS8_9STRA|nr:expressed unknown protein [Seminavis robusta]|eukprot:Sro255_g100390.1 n/a (214) ;mRNA; f:42843-43484
MTVPNIIVVVQEDESDLDSVVTFTEEDLEMWEEIFVSTTPTGLLGLPRYPRRRPSVKTEKNSSKSRSPPGLPKRQASGLSLGSSSAANDEADEPLAPPREIEKIEDLRSSWVPSPPKRRATFVFKDSVFEYINVLDFSDDEDEDEPESTSLNTDESSPARRRRFHRSSQLVPPKPPRRQPSMSSEDEKVAVFFESRVGGMTRIMPRIPSARSA